MLESFFIALLGELLKQLIDDLPSIVAGLQQLDTSALTDAPADPTLQSELTHVLDEAISNGDVPPA